MRKSSVSSRLNSIGPQNAVTTANLINSFGSLQNADQILNQFGCHQRYILLMTSLVSSTWAVAALPVMCGAFMTDNNESNNCSWNGTISITNNTDKCVQRNSITSEFNLRDERQYLAEWTTSAFMFGNMIGASTLTRLSDKIGRRPVLIFSLLVLGITGSLTALAEGIVSLTFGRFAQGISSPGAFLVAWVLGYETVPIPLRGLVTLLYGIMWVIGYCMVAPLAYYITNWRWLMVACTAPSILLAALYLCAIPESLHFLMANGRKEKAVEWIRNAQNYGKVVNKTNLDRMVEELERSAILEMQMRENGQEKIADNLGWSAVQQLQKHKIFIVYTLVLIFLWTSDTFVYFGISLYSTRLAGNKYWNYALSGLVELPAYIFAPPILERFGRKRIVAYTHFLAGVALTARLFVSFSYNWLTIACWLVAKFAISCSFICIYVYGSEIFPTTMRNICLGLCALIARFGGIIAPYVALLGSVNSLLPLMIFGAVSVLAGTLTLILPETKNRVLPSSLEEAENGNPTVRYVITQHCQ